MRLKIGESESNYIQSVYLEYCSLKVLMQDIIRNTNKYYDEKNYEKFKEDYANSYKQYILALDEIRLKYIPEYQDYYRIDFSSEEIVYGEEIHE